MMLSGMKKLRVVSLLSGMDHPFISISLFDRLLEPVFFLPIYVCLFITLDRSFCVYERRKP